MQLEALQTELSQHFADYELTHQEKGNELTLTVPLAEITNTLEILKSEKVFGFEILIDLCVVDYSAYGKTEWETNEATSTGFSRGRAIQKDALSQSDAKGRFAVVYHLLSVSHNHRLRVKTYLDDGQAVPTSLNIWPGANWFEREAYDLYGVFFTGHPDLRRILTDYGFIGYPFRKDFPVSGHVEMRYDAKQKRVVYEPVDIEPRVLVPKVVRHDSRYAEK